MVKNEDILNSCEVFYKKITSDLFPYLMGKQITFLDEKPLLIPEIESKVTNET